MEEYMICENCRINSETFGSICSVCGSETEYAPRTRESEIPVVKKIPTNSKANKNKAGTRVRFPWFFLH
jgi:predicted amidophosphoribosyltransferase